MDFTREPIIETVITPREGYRLVVRSSKGAGSEEHFVDALEVVSFGSGVFFRSLERPKPFIVPVADYEVLEVREPRMVLKTPTEQSAKAQPARQKRENEQPKREQQQPPQQEQPPQQANAQQEGQQPQEGRQDRNERRRDRRRGMRRRRGGRDDQKQEMNEPAPVEAMAEGAEVAAGESQEIPSSTPMLSSILPPPTKLIRDDLKRLREDYKGAFYINDDKEDDDDANLLGTPSEEDLSFREAPYAISEEDIRMTEGGDAEVPQDNPFRPSVVQEEANSGHQPDSP